jgi:hypothetical protein
MICSSVKRLGLVYENGNADGFFNKAAGAKPLVLVPKAIEVVKCSKP